MRVSVMTSVAFTEFWKPLDIKRNGRSPGDGHCSDVASVSGGSLSPPLHATSSARQIHPLVLATDRGYHGSLRWGASATQDVARDHNPLDLRGALVDLQQLGIAHQLLDRILLGVAVAAEDLDRVRRATHRGVGAEGL